jgi:signal peptidase II
LILGGAIGNLWDRVLSGHVVDFLLFYIGPHQWPVFNVADSAIVVGAGLLVLEILWAKSPKKATSSSF